VVVFEPSAVGDPELFREAWSLAHVVKYSHERLRDIADLELKRTEREGALLEVETRGWVMPVVQGIGTEREGALLEVETLGPDGLRYRSRLLKARTSAWRGVAAFQPEPLKDAAGSGDRCTAGLLHRLTRGGLRGLRATNAVKLRDALRYGQALASWNCGFDGARGGMYQVTKQTFGHQVEKILEGGLGASTLSGSEVAVAAKLLGCFCPSCKRAEFASVSRNTDGARAQG
jgi:fructokinase